MIEYRIDELFNNNVIAWQVVKKQVGRWPFKKWVVCHQERLYFGQSLEEAQKAIDNRVAHEKGHKVKNRYWKDDRGETPVDNYMW